MGPDQGQPQFQGLRPQLSQLVDERGMSIILGRRFTDWLFGLSGLHASARPQPVDRDLLLSVLRAETDPAMFPSAQHRIRHSLGLFTFYDHKDALQRRNAALRQLTTDPVVAAGFVFHATGSCDARR